MEFPLAGLDAYGKQRPATRGDGGDGPGVDTQRTCDFGGVKRPEFPGGEATAVGRVERGTHVGVGQRIGNVGGGGEQDGHSPAGGEASGGDFGSHAAGPHDAAVTCNNAVEVVVVADFGDEACAGVCGVAVVEPVNVGEQHQRVGTDEVRDQGCEPVIVAEAHFGGGHSVVFIHDGHHAELLQAVEGALRIAGTVALARVGRGEKHLPDGGVVAGKGPAPLLREMHLPDGGCGLFRGQISGPRIQPERRETCCDGPRGDDDHVRATGDARVHSVHNTVNVAGVDAEIRPAGQRRRPNLDHHALRRRKPRPHVLLAGRIDAQLLTVIHYYPCQRSRSATWPSPKSYSSIRPRRT